MNKLALIFFSILVLVANVATHQIYTISESYCELEGKEAFSLNIFLDGEIPESLEFQVTLTTEGEPTEEITATCSHEDDSKESEIAEKEKEDENGKPEKEKEEEIEKEKEAQKEKEDENGKPEKDLKETPRRVPGR